MIGQEHRQLLIHYIVTWKRKRPLLLLTVALSLTFVLIVYCGVMKDGENKNHVTLQYNPGHPRDLLLFSYMRSGSSLSAGLLRDSPSTFFVFEPLIPLAPYHYFTEKSVCRMRDSDCSQENADKRINEAVDTIRNLFTCNIRAVPQTVTNEILKQNKSGQAWNKYGKCLNASSSNNNKRQTERCLLDIEQDCREAETRVSKILRLGFVHIEKILSKLPNLNVLLLHRDPRAIINSRIKTDWFPVNEDEPDVVGNNIDSLCRKIETDLRLFGRTERKFSKRISKKKIEDVTSSATGMFDLFKFINKNVSKGDKDTIDTIMVRKKKKYLFRDWTNELKSEYKVLTETKCEAVFNDEKSRTVT